MVSLRGELYVAITTVLHLYYKYATRNTTRNTPVANKDGGGLMAQQGLPQADIHVRTDAELVMDRWGQMEWYVKFAGTTEFRAMPEWEQLKWVHEFAEMYLRVKPVFEVPDNAIRYPRPGEAVGRKGTYLPALAEMEEVRSEIAHHLNDLADGRGTIMGPFRRSLSVKFQHVHDEYGRREEPRYLIHRWEMGEGLVGYRDSLLRHMTGLLESYCDHIRRCPRPSCQKVFLQNRRQQAYCSRGCQSVAVMQKRRAEAKAKSPRKAKKTDRNRKRRSPDGTKRR